MVIFKMCPHPLLITRKSHLAHPFQKARRIRWIMMFFIAELLNFEQAHSFSVKYRNNLILRDEAVQQSPITHDSSLPLSLLKIPLHMGKHRILIVLVRFSNGCMFTARARDCQSSPFHRLVRRVLCCLTFSFFNPSGALWKTIR